MILQPFAKTFWPAFLATAAFVALLLVPLRAEAAKPLNIEVLSSGADRVTGGDALIGVRAPDRKARDRMIVRVNGKIVTGSLKVDPADARRRIGLVTGLRNGRNWISAWAPGRSAARLSVYNSSLQGPVFSGPHQNPFYCTTERFDLGPAQGPDCVAPTRVRWVYRASDNTFKPLANPTDRPADLVQTTTRTGQTVDYVVRLEQGVINRAVYNFATLAAGGQVGDGWNGRFFYIYGGGCSAGHQQGQNASGGLDHDLLRRGFVVLGSSLNVFNTSCNDVLSAETTSMLKEHAIEALGRPDVWTAGEGGSGGSVQIQMIAQNYPGLLDGITPAASFPDNSSPDYADCRLLQNYFVNHPEGQSLTNAHRKSITGMFSNTNGGCNPLSAGADVVNASEGCIESIVPVSVIFDPFTNPKGVRCTIWDNMVNVYGQDPVTGYARRTYDNTGVQYGLEALQQANINLKRFLDLNEFIGGFDVNGRFQPSRSVGDQEAIDIAYRTGRFNTGAGNWTNLPVIDRRTYEDDDASGNVHQYLNTYRLRARLDRYNGSHANQVMFRAKGGASVNAMNDAATDLLSSWLDGIAADGSAKSQAQKVLDHKPANATDACWIGGNRSEGVALIGDSNVCQTTYAPYSLPANRAGKPLDSITAKCTLKPVDPADYGSPTAIQIARLNSIFPNGVCDWSKPGPGETRLQNSNLNRSYGPPQTIRVNARRLKLKLNRHRVTPGRRVSTVKLTATLGPCPAVTWQRVRFERRPKRRKATWKPIGSKIVTGNKCRATVRPSKVRQPTEVRVRALSIDGFKGANSPVRTIRVTPAKRHRR